MASAMGEGMVNSPKPPFFFIDGDDVGVFATIEELRLFLEPWAVKGKDLLATDSEGHPLSFRIIKSERPLIFGLFHTEVEQVEFDKLGDSPDHRQALRAALVKFLGSRGFAEYAIRDESLDALAKRALAAERP